MRNLRNPSFIFSGIGIAALSIISGCSKPAGAPPSAPPDAPAVVPAASLPPDVPVTDASLKNKSLTPSQHEAVFKQLQQKQNAEDKKTKD